MLRVATVRKHCASVQCGYMLQAAGHCARTRVHNGQGFACFSHGFRVLAATLRDQ